MYFPRVLPLPNGTGIHMHAVLTLHIIVKKHAGMPLPSSHGYVATIMLCSQRCSMGNMSMGMFLQCYYIYSMPHWNSVTRYNNASSIGNIFNLRIQGGAPEVAVH